MNTSPIGIYVIIDTVANDKSPLFYAKTDGQAVREFKRFLEPSSSAKMPPAQDFTLFRVGKYDDQNHYISNTEKTLILEGIYALADDINADKGDD